MSELLITLAVLACPVGMGLMMVFMMRGRRGDTHQPPREDGTDMEIARLRAEVDQLRATQRDTQSGNALRNEADRQ